MVAPAASQHGGSGAARRHAEHRNASGDAFEADLDRDDVLTRRRLLRRLLMGALAAVGAAFAVPAALAGSAPGSRPRSTRVRGARARGSSPRTGSRCTWPTSRPAGSSPCSPRARSTPRAGQAVLVRVEPDLVRPLPGRESWTPQGLVAYSKVCTHAGCPVGLYEAASHQLLCPCHQSTFDVLDGAKPVFGPAAARLAAAAVVDRRDRLRRRDGRVQRAPRALVLEPVGVNARTARVDSVVLIAIVVAAAGCSGKSPSILDTHGSESSRIAGVWWLMFGLGAAVYAIVAFFVVWAIVRGRRRKSAGRRAGQRQRVDRLGWGRRSGRDPRSAGRGDGAGDVRIAPPRGGRVAGARRRQALVVAGLVSGHAVHDRERDPSPGRSAGRDPSRLRQRHPQLLGARSSRARRT